MRSCGWRIILDYRSFDVTIPVENLGFAVSYTAEERTFLRKVVAWLPHRYLLPHNDNTGESDAAANC
jgi:hypothetical protein